MLAHLVYVSAATRRPTRDDLLDILSISRRNNDRNGVTGMLLYSGGTYMQVLEGELEVLEETYARMSLDPRHRIGEVLLREPQDHRSFPDWTMGFANVDDLPEEVRDSVRPLLAPEVQESNPQRAHRLLRAFRLMAAQDIG